MEPCVLTGVVAGCWICSIRYTGYTPFFDLENLDNRSSGMGSGIGSGVGSGNFSGFGSGVKSFGTLMTHSSQYGSSASSGAGSSVGSGVNSGNGSSVIGSSGVLSITGGASSTKKKKKGKLLKSKRKKRGQDKNEYWGKCLRVDEVHKSIHACYVLTQFVVPTSKTGIPIEEGLEKKNKVMVHLMKQCLIADPAKRITPSQVNTFLAFGLTCVINFESHLAGQKASLF